jgi:hypothetical protein
MNNEGIKNIRTFMELKRRNKRIGKKTFLKKRKRIRLLKNSRK